MGYLMTVAAFIIWGFTSTVILRAVPLTGPAASSAGCLIGAAAMLAVLGPKRWPEVLGVFRRHAWRLAGLGAAFAGCSFTYQWSVKSTSVANAVLTHSLQPILTCLVFIPLWGGPKTTAKGYGALALGIAGLALLLGPQLSWEGPLLGVLLGAASAGFFSWYLVQVPFFKEHEPQTLQIAVLLSAAAFLLPAWFFNGPVVLDARGIGATLAFGLLNFALANVLYFRAMRRIPMGHVATLAYVEPVVAIVSAAAFLGEPMTAGVIGGGLLILASGALVIFDRPGRKGKEEKRKSVS
ncbi:MAG TPA: DMT family transporter [Candidatus Eisenbacteria bacterium]|nr:DMT family transporter [Candidatus Eisenbacteria bacterium]